MNVKLLILAGLIGLMPAFSCNPRFKHAHNALVVDAKQFIGDFSNNDGVFAGVAQFDTEFDSIKYQTACGTYTVANDGSANCVIGRYDPKTYALLWVAVGGGKGIDKACRYFTIFGSDSAIYVAGFFSDTALFFQNDRRSTATVRSHGMTDIFFAKYRYRDGYLLWINSGGSVGRDLGYAYRDAQGRTFLHDESTIHCDSTFTRLFLWARCFGTPVSFENIPNYTIDNISINTDSSKFVRIAFDSKTGVALGMQLDSIMP